MKSVIRMYKVKENNFFINIKDINFKKIKISYTILFIYLLLLSLCLLALDELLVLHLVYLFHFLYIYLPSYPLYYIALS